MVAFPLASNAVGTITPSREIVELAHAAGALAWADANTLRAARSKIPRARLRRYPPRRASSSARYLGLAWVPPQAPAEAGGLQGGRGRRAHSRRHETRPRATTPLGFVACVSDTCTASAQRSSAHTSVRSGSGSSTGTGRLARARTPTMAGRVPTFCVAPRRDAGRGGGTAGGEPSLGRELPRGGCSCTSGCPTAPCASASSTRTSRTRSTGCSRRCRGPSRRGGCQGLLGDAARAEARREARHRVMASSSRRVARCSRPGYRR